MAEAGAHVDPLRSYNFKLEINGIVEGHFTDCTGLGVNVQVITYREGGNAQTTYKLPGPVTYGDVTLKYGLTQSTDVWQWFMAAVDGRLDRRNVSIVLLDNDGVTERMRWNLFNAWLAQWTGTMLSAASQTIAVEQMKLVFETLERA
jgi:phage tail-like protein